VKDSVSIGVICGCAHRQAGQYLKMTACFSDYIEFAKSKWHILKLEKQIIQRLKNGGNHLF
jgi:hypothetical protein